jgi:L-threonate 2-dehydrogenase
MKKNQLETQFKTHPASSIAKTMPARHHKPQVLEPKKLTVGVLGLGIMGSAMSMNMIKAGLNVIGFDPNPVCRRNHLKAGGVIAKDLTTLGLSTRRVICSLPTSQALLEVAQSLTQIDSHRMIIADTSTLDVSDKEIARKILLKGGHILLDCPLSGTGAQARNKDLLVYSSGPKSAVKEFESIFATFSKTHHHLGTFGNGMKMKLIANLLVAIHNVSTAEALLFSENLGIDSALAVEVLSAGAGGSRMLQIRGPSMASRDWENPTMKVSTWQKDMSLIHDALTRSQTPAPLFSSTQVLYNAAMGLGHADHDTAAVFDVLARMSKK